MNTKNSNARTSSSTSTSQEMAAQRKQQQNDSRVSQTVRMINKFQEIVSLGYSDENWAHAAYILVEFGYTAEKAHVDSLGSLMTEAYVQPSFQRIQQVCNSVMLGATGVAPYDAPRDRAGSKRKSF